MIFRAAGSEIPKRFVEVFGSVFGISFEGYLTHTNRGFIALVVTDEFPNGIVAARFRLDETTADSVAKDAVKMGLPKALGAYYSASKTINQPLSNDVLLITQRWQDLGNKDCTAIAYHEACHCFHASGFFKQYPESSEAYKCGNHYRKYTRYHDENDGHHDPQWFALLAAKSHLMRASYSDLFTRSHDVIESALIGDLLLSEGETLPLCSAEENSL